MAFCQSLSAIMIPHRCVKSRDRVRILVLLFLCLKHRPGYGLVTILCCQGWLQEFSDGGLTLPTKGLKCGFTSNINSTKNRFSPSDGGLTCSDGGLWPPSPPLVPPLFVTYDTRTFISLLVFENCFELFY